MHTYSSLCLTIVRTVISPSTNLACITTGTYTLSYSHDRVIAWKSRTEILRALCEQQAIDFQSSTDHEAPPLFGEIFLRRVSLISRPDARVPGKLRTERSLDSDLRSGEDAGQWEGKS